MSQFTYTEATWPAAQCPPLKFEFINWRSDRRAFFLRDESGSLVVATPQLPKLADDWQFPEPSFPECAAVAVRPYRLIPPPVRSSAEDSPGRTVETVASGNGRWTVPERWEQSYGQFIYPTDSDQPALLELLKQANAARKKKCEHRMKEATSWTREEVRRHLKGERRPRPDEGVKPESVLEFLRDPDPPASDEITDAEFETFCEHERGAAQRLGLDKPFSMEDLLRDVDGLLSSYLRALWAKEHGFDLNCMGWEDRDGHTRGWRRDPREFLEWMKRHCLNAFINHIGHPALGATLGFHLPGWQQQMALLATVRYVAEFENGGRVFLAGLEIRPPRADERKELNDFRQVVSRAPQPRARGSAVSDEELAKWPELIGAKELIRLGVAGKNSIHDAAAKLGLTPVIPTAKQKKYRLAAVLTKLGRKHP